MKKLAALALLTTLALAGAPANASHKGCTAVAVPVDPNGSTGYCTYVAEGPGTFTAQTYGHWKIEVIRSNVRQTIAEADKIFDSGYVPGRPTIWSPEEGTIATEAGDTVILSIGSEGIAVPTTPQTVVKLPRGGFIKAGDTA